MSVKFAQSPTEILQWERLVISDRRLSHAVVRVATRLVLFVNSQSGLAWPSLKALMDKSQTSLSTVKRAIRQLKALGWVAVISGNARRTNRYRMVLQPLPADSLTPSVPDTAPVATPPAPVQTTPPPQTPAPVNTAPVQAPAPPPASPPATPMSHDRAAYLPTPRSCTPEEIVALIEHFNRTAHTCLPTTPGTDTYRTVRQALQ
ncbi:helix-turn-helix domain-containing protein, partial [Thiorhodospira sibirica]|uniref:helix-turn-helix domain-containing protein n=1 Tax=Thiorhodospira sibirica TaxID=154347 RepID=UPI001C8E00A6